MDSEPIDQQAEDPRQRCGSGPCLERAALVLLGALSIAAGAFESPAAAQAGMPRITVRLASSQDADFLARLRGQLSDVSVDVQASPTPPLERAIDTQVDSAKRLATEQAASGVIWFDESSDAPNVSVHLFDAALPEHVVRRVQGGERARSELLEAVALVTRSLVVARRGAWASLGTTSTESPIQGAHDQTTPTSPRPRVPAPRAASPAASDADAVQHQLAVIDVREPVLPPPSAATRSAASHAATAASVTANPPAAQPRRLQLSAAESGAFSASRPKPQAQASHDQSPEEPEPDAVAPGQDESAASGVGVGPRAQMFAGAQSVIDGASQYGQRGVVARVGASFGPWSVAAYGSASFGSDIADRFVELRVSRHSLGLSARFERPSLAGTHWSAGLHAGAVVFDRTSSEKFETTAVTRAKQFAVIAFGPEFAISWVPSLFGIGLHAALDILPGAPSFALHDRAGQPVVTHTLWTLEPRVSLGLEARL